MRLFSLNGFVIPGRLLCKRTRNPDFSARRDAEIPDSRSAASGMTMFFYPRHRRFAGDQI